MGCCKSMPVVFIKSNLCAAANSHKKATAAETKNANIHEKVDKKSSD